MRSLACFRVAIAGFVLAAASVLHGADTNPVAVIWTSGEGSDSSDASVNALTGLIREAGYAVESLRIPTLLTDHGLSPGELDATRQDLLVLPNARHLPPETVAPIKRFLDGGGDVLAFNLPAWEDPVFHIGDQWLTRADYAAALSRQRPEVRLLDLAQADALTWLRHSDQPGHATR
ncbi:MAG: hypothetical protein H7A46_25175, partial [Verrucomicrobiales bacterium]|nr:hypothetical protein [Verrucomicrobiales bacterium]